MPSQKDLITFLVRTFTSQNLGVFIWGDFELDDLSADNVLDFQTNLRLEIQKSLSDMGMQDYPYGILVRLVNGKLVTFIDKHERVEHMEYCLTLMLDKLARMHDPNAVQMSEDKFPDDPAEVEKLLGHYDFSYALAALVRGEYPPKAPRLWDRPEGEAIRNFIPPTAEVIALAEMGSILYFTPPQVHSMFHKTMVDALRDAVVELLEDHSSKYLVSNFYITLSIDGTLAVYKDTDDLVLEVDKDASQLSGAKPDEVLTYLAQLAQEKMWIADVLICLMMGEMRSDMLGITAELDAFLHTMAEAISKSYGKLLVFNLSDFGINDYTKIYQRLQRHLHLVMFEENVSTIEYTMNNCVNGSIAIYVHDSESLNKIKQLIDIIESNPMDVAAQLIMERNEDPAILLVLYTMVTGEQPGPKGIWDYLN